jgi:hypothetical protein
MALVDVENQEAYLKLSKEQLLMKRKRKKALKISISLLQDIP